MPLRDIDPDLLTHLSGEVVTLALCVKLTRRDGTILGFTSYDKTLLIADELGNNIAYQARSSLEASALRQESSSGVDNLEVVGLLQSDLITEADIRAGLYDGAAIEFFLVNFKDLTQGRLFLLKGYIGELNISPGSFTAEIRSLTQKAQQAVGDLTSPSCRVKQLGDERCKIVLAPFQFARTVAQIDSPFQVRFTSDSHPDNYFTYGRVIVLSGANAGFIKEVKGHQNVLSNALITLQDAFPYDFVIGDAVTLEAGCDRAFDTCRDKFSNVVNFRGEPHVPGTDQIIKVGRK